MSARHGKIARDNAVQQIAQSLAQRDAGTKGGTILIGAGCSATAGVPLAPALVGEAVVRFSSFCAGIVPGVPGAYGQVMQRLTPQQRRALLDPHIRAAKLNWGHIALAHMMAKGAVARVLSVNFDSILARACGLLGLYPAIYDFGTAPASNLKGLAEPAIIHLHGQSTGFVQLNSDAETAAHVAKLKPVIADSIQSRTLLVVGYSGGSDGVLDAIAAAYDDNTLLYWADLAEEPSAAVAAFLANKPYAHFVGGADADRFLLDVARAIAEIDGTAQWTPRIFHDPVGHLLAEMEPVAEFPVTAKNTDDILSVWRKNMARLKEMHDEAFGRERAEETAQIQGGETAIGDAVGSVETPDAVQSQAAKRRAYWAKLQQADELDERAKTLTGQEANAAFAAAQTAYAEATALIDTPHEALYNWGTVLAAQAQRADGAEADRLFTLAGEKFAAALAIKPDKHEALNNWGNALMSRAKHAVGADRDRLFEEAGEKLAAADRIKPGSASYNFACLMALTGLPDDCRAYLLAARQHGRLPSRAHLEADTDLESVRRLPWFADILALAA